MKGCAEKDLDRTNANGKASSVQFIHFPFENEEIKLFTNNTNISIGINHSCYRHSTLIDRSIISALASDFS